MNTDRARGAGISNWRFEILKKLDINGAKGARIFLGGVAGGDRLQ